MGGTGISERFEAKALSGYALIKNHAKWLLPELRHCKPSGKAEMVDSMPGTANASPAASAVGVRGWVKFNQALPCF